jgi:hypothetical protein
MTRLLEQLLARAKVVLAGRPILVVEPAGLGSTWPLSYSVTPLRVNGLRNFSLHCWHRLRAYSVARL